MELPKHCIHAEHISGFCATWVAKNSVSEFLAIARGTAVINHNCGVSVASICLGL